MNEAATASKLKTYLSRPNTVLPEPLGINVTVYNVETGRTYLDVSVIVTNKRRALSLARRYNQEGIFDLYREEYTEVGGTGEAMENMPALTERLPPLRRRRLSE